MSREREFEIAKREREHADNWALALIIIICASVFAFTVAIFKMPV